MNSADSTVMMMFLDVSVANVAMSIFSPIKISKSRIPKSIRWATTNISVVTRSNHISIGALAAIEGLLRAKTKRPALEALFANDNCTQHSTTALATGT